MKDTAHHFALAFRGIHNGAHVASCGDELEASVKPEAYILFTVGAHCYTYGNARSLAFFDSRVYKRKNIRMEYIIKMPY